MHRSGTSFVASLLHAAGLDLGSRLMPAARGNERGHFENLDFVDFHMRWLRLTGHDDSGWAAVQPLKLPEEAVSEAEDILERNARASGWGWKDPRATLFLDFWSNIVPDANYLYIYREPAEVIDSLYRRGDRAIKLSPELAARAYLAHSNMMLDHLRLHRDRSIVANVSAIARDPQAFLTSISERFGVDLDALAPSTFEGALMRTAATDAPLATLLRHHVPEVGHLYATLEELADIPDGSTDKKHSLGRSVKEAFFTDWRQSLQRDAELRSVNAALSASETSNTQRGEYLAQAERVLEAERAAHDSAVQQLREVADRERVEHDAAMEQLRAAADREHESALQQLCGKAEDALAENAGLRADLEQARTQNLNLEQRIESTTRELLTQTQALVASTRAESDRFTFLIDTVQSSKFWKIKRGVNRLRRFLSRP